MSDELYDWIADTKYRYQLIHCDLCNNYNWRTGKISSHGAWSCHKYNTPQKARQRCIDNNLCVACVTPIYDHKGGCDISSISRHNEAVSIIYPDNPLCPEICYRCVGRGHVF